MIIGINGKIGSGKNLVCTIIQGLTAAKKHNIENPSFEWIKKYYINSIWEQKAFAAKLKQIGSILSGIETEKFEDQDFKKTLMGSEWDYESEPMLVREFLQKLGTEAIRNGLHTNVWINALFADYKSSYVQHPNIEYMRQKVYSNWIITDMRFPNEMEAIKARHGITIRVIRPQFIINGKVIIKDLHPSETALDDAKFDYEIINDGTIEELIEKVREILIKQRVI